MPPQRRTRLVVGLGVGLIAASGLVSWMTARKPPEVQIAPALDCDSEWLVQGTSDIDYSTGQVNLWLANSDPTLCYGQGMIDRQVSLMAHRYFSQALVDHSNPKNPNYKKTVPAILISYGRNITVKMKDNAEPKEKAMYFQQMRALMMAIKAYMTGQSIPIINGPDVNMAINMLDRVEEDIKLYYQSNPEGISQQQRKDRAASKELDKDFVPLN